MASPGASLDLLKGKNTPSQVEETAAPEDEGSEEVQIDIDSLSKAEIDKLVADPEYDISPPAEWPKMKLADKKAWLKSQFPEADEAEEAIETSTGETKASAAEEALAPEPAAAAATKPKAKGGKGKSAPAAQAEATAVAAEAVEARPTKDGKKSSGDKISDLAYEVEHLKEKPAKELVVELRDANDFSAIKLGGVLAKIQASGWWAPYESFRQFVEQAHGMKYRRAMYWVQIYNDLVESKVPWNVVQHIGWTKLREISSVITLENVKHWVELAETNTVIQLREFVASHKKADDSEGESDGSDQSSKVVSTKTFKVHDDQKEVIADALAKNKNQSGTDYDTTALVNICTDYLSKPTLVQLLQQVGLDKALSAVEEAFPDYAITAAEKEEQAAA